MVFEDEQGVEHAMVHGDDVTDYRRTIDGYTIAGAFVFTTPAVVESYWQESSRRVEEATTEQMKILSTDSGDNRPSVNLEHAAGITTSYPVIENEAARRRQSLEPGDLNYIDVRLKDVLEESPSGLMQQLGNEDATLEQTAELMAHEFLLCWQRWLSIHQRVIDSPRSWV